MQILAQPQEGPVFGVDEPAAVTNFAAAIAVHPKDSVATQPPHVPSSAADNEAVQEHRPHSQRTQNFHPFTMVGHRSFRILSGMSAILSISARFQVNTDASTTGPKAS